MAPEPPHPTGEPKEPVPDFQEALSNLSNPELLSALDLALLELEKRLFRYARVGPELLEMADEGLVLAARAKARLGQSLSAAQSRKTLYYGLCGRCGRYILRFDTSDLKQIRSGSLGRR
jgi:hypothetical protein